MKISGFEKSLGGSRRGGGRLERGWEAAEAARGAGLRGAPQDRSPARQASAQKGDDDDPSWNSDGVQIRSKKNNNNSNFCFGLEF